MSEPKNIVYQDNKLLVDGKESTIEDAESELKKEVIDFENSIKDFLLSNLALKKEDIEKLSDTIIKTRMDLANNQINIFDFGEYFRTSKIITKGHELVDKILLNLNSKKKKITKIKKDEDLKIGWKYNYDNNPNYEPKLYEVLEMITTRLISDVVFWELKKQFHSDLNIDKDKITVSGDFENEFVINIQVEKINISFKIDKNNGSFEDINELYIASSFKIGLLVLQDSSSNYLKYGNNFRTAQTLENVIAKEIRFFKTYIKSEILYLDESFFNAEKKLSLAYLFREYFSIFMDRKQKKQLDFIITNCENIIKENKQKIYEEQSFIEDKNSSDLEPKLEDIDWNNIEINIKNSLNDLFYSSSDNIGFDIDSFKDKKIFKLHLSGQKVEILVDSNRRVFVSSVNSIGIGKNDIRNFEVLDEVFEQKIFKATLISYKPLLIRQIENIFSNIKGKKSKIIAREIEEIVKSFVFDVCDNNINVNNNIEKVSDTIFEILDSFVYFDRKSNEQIINLIDKLLKIIYSYSFRDYVYNKLKNVNFNLYQELSKLYDIDDDLVSITEGLKKKFQRILKAGKLITELNNYISILDSDSINKESFELKIKRIADDLSEDSILGFISRKILGLLNVSESSKDDLFKYNLEKITEQLFDLIDAKEE